MAQKIIAMDSQMLTALMYCPREYHFKFNLSIRKKGGKSNSLECGSIAHTILEFYHKALINGKSRNEAIAIGFAAGKEYIYGYQENNIYIVDKKEKPIKNTPIGLSTKELIGTDWVFKTMEQYFDFYKNHSWTPIEAESVRGKIIYEDSDIKILWKAKYDLIEDTPYGLIPTDHKSTKRSDAVYTTNDSQFMGQVVLLDGRRMIKDEIGWQTSLRPDEKFKRHLIPYSVDRMKEWCNEIVPHYARMLLAYYEADNFPPCFTSCSRKFGMCDYEADVCTADRNLRDTAIKTFFEVVEPWDVMNQGK